MKFVDFLNESYVNVYHGSNKNFNKIDSKYFMLDISNVQEGIGLYFGDYKTAEGYGKYVKTISVNPRNFMESHDPMSKLPKRKVVSMFKKLQKLDNEAIFYLATDYGIYAEKPSDIKDFMLKELYDMMKDEELRNFQIMLAQNFDGEKVAAAWNDEFPKIHGLKNSDFGFYIVINTNYKLEEV